TRKILKEVEKFSPLCTLTCSDMIFNHVNNFIFYYYYYYYYYYYCFYYCLICISLTSFMLQIL
ncbi:MAG: hypothetical protein N7Q72_05420, partial [Spiroplasma sp. Tabriz.8]|nr:hypothetical protein [Candidatus Regiella insecticola]MCX2959788.1 hypothetical protein [Serratia symbiotica]MCZ8632685.1 hypothetical protein [Spiroplasma sp. Tabriz.8]